MAVTDPVVLAYNEKWDFPWYLVRGRESFYIRDVPDDDPMKDVMRRWADPNAAVQWAKDELGVDHVVNEEVVEQLEGLYIANDEMAAELAEAVREAKRAKQKLENRPTQISMFADGEDD